MTAPAIRPGPILLLGAAGQIGCELRRDLAGLGPLVAMTRQDIDITDAGQVTRLVSDLQPGIVVNAAAYTAVDRAESDPELAHLVNAVAVGVIAEACRAAGAFMVHFSTDYVFDGTAPAPYSPGDVPNPLSVYGHSKLAGEQAIRAAGAAAVVFRTSWVFGQGGHNFVKTILRLAAEREELRVVDDQIGQPTPAALVSAVTVSYLRRVVAGTVPAAGLTIHHLASSHPVSWHAFACAIVAQATASGWKLRTNVDRIAPISTGEWPLPARRPANSRLDCSLLVREVGADMPDWAPYLHRMIGEMAG